MSRGLGQLQRRILDALGQAKAAPLARSTQRKHADHELTHTQLKETLFGRRSDDRRGLQMQRYDHTNLRRALAGLKQRGIITERHVQPERHLHWVRVYSLTEQGKRMHLRKCTEAFT